MQGGISVATELLTINGTGVSNDGALRSMSGNNTYAGAVTLAGNAQINAEANTLTLGGIIGASSGGIGVAFGGADWGAYRWLKPSATAPANSPRRVICMVAFLSPAQPWAAMISSMRALVPLMSGMRSPALMRARVFFSAACMPMARSAAAVISPGFSTSTPFSSASTASPGDTATPPQEMSVQNSPCRLATDAS